MKQNRGWLFDKLRNGYKVIDIGVDPERKIRSVFYQMEEEVLRRTKRLLRV